MARITICDLCKNRIKDKESEQGLLALSFYIFLEVVPCGNADCATSDIYCAPCAGGVISKPAKLDAELCLSCTTMLRKAIEGDEPLRAAQKPEKKPARFEAPAVEYTLVDAYGPAGEALGPSEEEKAVREPTKELLEDEMTRVPSRFNKSTAAKVVAAKKDKCNHWFKSYEEGSIICGDAPLGIKGALANFKGCSKKLVKGEY